MTTLFEYPKSTAYGRVLPKGRIYKRFKPTAAMQKKFFQHVLKISWQHKLAPEIVNIKATSSVPEIQIFNIALKDEVVKTDILRYIDRAIPSPIVFELMYDGKIKPIAAFKRPSRADASKWTISEYFDDDWVAADTPRRPLPMSIDFGELYGHLLRPLMPYPARLGESLSEQVVRIETIHTKQLELTNCLECLGKEKYFKHRVSIHRESCRLEQELVSLTCLHPDSDNSTTPPVTEVNYD